MKVLILSPYPEKIINILDEEGDSYFVYNHILNLKFLEENKVDFIVSYGYKHIISERIVNYMKRSIINLHISYLPFNRGAYPNLWSHIEGTPSGITIHRIDKGIDTGDILLRKKVFINTDEHNFLSSYNLLREEVENLFNKNWKHLRLNQLKKINNFECGSYHNKVQGDEILKKLPKRWETNISEALKII